MLILGDRLTYKDIRLILIKSTISLITQKLNGYLN
nr:MAG TPA: hypothetical protein [Podoviridae sp. ctY3D12]